MFCQLNCVAPPFIFYMHTSNSHNICLCFLIAFQLDESLVHVRSKTLLGHMTKLQKMITEESTDVRSFRKIIEAVVTGNYKVLFSGKATVYNWFKTRIAKTSIDAFEAEFKDNYVEVERLAAKLNGHAIDKITVFTAIAEANVIFTEVEELEQSVVTLTDARKSVIECVAKSNASGLQDKQQASMKVTREFKPFQDMGVPKRLYTYMRFNGAGILMEYLFMFVFCKLSNAIRVPHMIVWEYRFSSCLVYLYVA